MLITRSHFLVATVTSALALVSCSAEAEPKYGFGKAASASEVQAADIDVRYDGLGLPPGSGSAEEGAKIFAAQCATCHGAKLEGNSEMYIKPLLGKARHSIDMRPYAPPLFAYVRRAMPLTAPGSLSNDQTYALVAFLLREAGIDQSPESAMDADRLKSIEMPNRANFVPAKGSGVPAPK